MRLMESTVNNKIFELANTISYRGQVFSKSGFFPLGVAFDTGYQGSAFSTSFGTNYKALELPFFSSPIFDKTSGLYHSATSTRNIDTGVYDTIFYAGNDGSVHYIASARETNFIPEIKSSINIGTPDCFTIFDIGVDYGIAFISKANSQYVFKKVFTASDTGELSAIDIISQSTPDKIINPTLLTIDSTKAVFATFLDNQNITMTSINPDATASTNTIPLPVFDYTILPSPVVATIDSNLYLLVPVVVDGEVKIISGLYDSVNVGASNIVINDIDTSAFSEFENYLPYNSGDAFLFLSKPFVANDNNTYMILSVIDIDAASADLFGYSTVWLVKVSGPNAFTLADYVILPNTAINNILPLLKYNWAKGYIYAEEDIYIYDATAGNLFISHYRTGDVKFFGGDTEGRIYTVGSKSSYYLDTDFYFTTQIVARFSYTVTQWSGSPITVPLAIDLKDSTGTSISGDCVCTIIEGDAVFADNSSKQITITAPTSVNVTINSPGKIVVEVRKA